MFVKSAEIENIGDKKYLRVYLDSKYPYQVKHNNESFDMFDFCFEEPNMNDLNDLRKVSIAIEKMISFADVKSVKIANLFSKETMMDALNFRAEQEQIINEEKTEEEKIPKGRTEDEIRISCKELIDQAFAKSIDFEDESTNYFEEIQKIFNFIEKKCNRERGDGLVLRTSLSVLDQYRADAHFIKEEIASTFISFFFTHFPSKSLFVEANRERLNPFLKL